MSTSTTTVNTGSQLYTDYNREKIFIGKNTFENATMINSSGGDLTYPAGTLLGRISASGKVQPLASAAVDGSQFPVGILTDSVTIVDGAETTISMAVSGEVDSTLVVLDGSDTLETVITGRRIKDRIAADTLGIKLITATDLTAFDNS